MHRRPSVGKRGTVRKPCHNGAFREPKAIMQQKNFTLFILLSFLIFIAWQQLMNRIWPPVRHLRLPDQRAWAALPGHVHGLLEQAPGLPGLGGACNLATQIALADWAAGEWQGPVPEEKEKEPEPTVKEEPAVEPVAEAAEHREPSLGSDDETSPFNLKVVLTSRGGGVLSMILNKFAQANRLGKPADPPSRLELVPEDADGFANFLLYHYLLPVEGQPEHPADTLGKREWRTSQSVEKDEQGREIHQVVFITEVPHLDVRITKTYTLAPGTYHVGLALKFELLGNKPLSFRYQLAGAHGLPIEGDWYTNVYRTAVAGLVDKKNELWPDRQDARAIGYQAGGRKVERSDDRFIRYAGVANQYFASVIAVDDHQESGVSPNFLAWLRPTVEAEPQPKKQFLDDVTVRLISEPFELKPGAPVVHQYILYNGPVKVRLLGHLDGDKAVAEDLVERYQHTLHLSKLTDFGSYGFWTNLIIACTNLMHGLLYYLHQYVMPWSYGLCIILLTVLVRGSMFPLSRRQSLATAKFQAKMQELAPDLKKLEEKHKNDPMALHQAKMELFKKRGVNQFAMLGTCWMMFLQMPIFLGLYYALQESIHFRLASFLWIGNLAAPDMLFSWGEGIPFISRPADLGSSPFYLGPFFNLLPIIAVTLMIVQQKVMTPPPTDEQQAMQQKTMKWMMILMGFMFYKVAAGLCLYFIASNLWGLAERKLLPKRQLAGGAGGAGQAARKPVSPSGGPARGKPRGKGDGNGAVRKMRDLWEKLLKEAEKKK
jgi:YidC/Oxa1 family membrane protein insertase